MDLSLGRAVYSFGRAAEAFPRGAQPPQRQQSSNYSPAAANLRQGHKWRSAAAACHDWQHEVMFHLKEMLICKASRSLFSPRSRLCSWRSRQIPGRGGWPPVLRRISLRISKELNIRNSPCVGRIRRESRAERISEKQIL